MKIRILLLIAALIPLTRPAWADSPPVYLPVILKQLPPGVYVTSHSHYTYTGLDGGPRTVLAGEVLNNTQKTVLNFSIPVEFFNGETLVDTDRIFSNRYRIAPGQTLCFQELLFGQPAANPANWTRYELDAVTWREGTQTLPALAVFNDAGTLDASGRYRVAGMIRNDSPAPVDDLRIQAAIYDAAGIIIDCEDLFTGLASRTLAPGEATGFNIDFGDNGPFGRVVRWRVVGDGGVQ